MSRSEEVRFRAGDATLEGSLVLPDGEGRHPWVLLLASWLPRDRDGAWDRARHAAWFAPLSPDAPHGLLARLAHGLAEHGVASFRYDKRGCGASDGAWERAALFTLIDDARDAIGALRGRPELDLRRTGLIGHGEGAAIALSVAIGDPAVSALTLIGPSARSLSAVLRRGVAERGRSGMDRDHPAVAAIDRASEELVERAERGERSMRLVIGAESVELHLSGWEQAMRTPPLALATMLHRSVTLVHGESDPWAHPDESRLLAGALPASTPSSLELIPGAGHELAEVHDRRIGDMAGELTGRIEPRELPPVLLAIESASDSG